MHLMCFFFHVRQQQQNLGQTKSWIIPFDYRGEHRGDSTILVTLKSRQPTRCKI